jgi:CBS domain-containing protein
MRVADAISPNPICCTASCPVQTAAKLMQQVEHGVIPVLEEDGSRIVGVITDRDLCLRVLGRAADGAKTLVGDCMSANPLYCHASDDAYLVLELITNQGLRGMVVLNEQGGLEGVISVVALANKLAAASKALCSALEQLYGRENKVETNAADKTDEFREVKESSPTGPQHKTTAQKHQPQDHVRS